MAGNGPAPKKNRSRKRDTDKRRAVKADGALHGFPLPDDVLPIDKDTNEREQWHPQTVRWWDHWRSSPQAVDMLTEPDWDFLLDTALIHHNFWTNGRWEFANELRLRAAKFGATPEDRLRLKIEIAPDNPYPAGDGVGGAGDAIITELDSIRDALTGS